jgi:hypothetical protein
MELALLLQLVQRTQAAAEAVVPKELLDQDK